MKAFRYLFLIITVLAALSAIPTPCLAEQAKAFQDFRKTPLQFKSDLERVQPSVDVPFLARHLELLLTTSEPLGRKVEETHGLSIAVQVRVDKSSGYPVPEKFAQYIEFMLPGKVDVAMLDVSENDRALIAALVEEFSEVEKTYGFRVDGSGAADILVRLNLTNRRQTAEGFGYETLPRLSERKIASTELDESLYLLPWSLVRMYFSGYDDARSIVGGEVWIDYSVRNFLQESVARLALDNPDFSAKMGLGATRSEVIARYQPPTQTDLPLLSLALSRGRQRWEGPVPVATLLSAGRELIVPSETAIGAPSFGSNGSCLAEAHAVALRGRLARSLAMFRTGYRLGRYLLNSDTDLYSRFQTSPSQFLGEWTLVGYEQSFDHRLDDGLSRIALRFSSKPEQRENYAALKTRAERFVTNTADIAKTLSASALMLRQDLCLMSPRLPME